MCRLWIVILILINITAIALGKCTISGRFLNDDVADCKGYIMCIPSSSAGGFVQYNLTCPLSFAFDPLDKVCTNVTSFECPDKVPFQCPTLGTFENSLIKGCSSFILCSQNYNGDIKPIVLRCPIGTLFNPILSECVNSIEYECQSNETPTEPNNIEVTNVFVPYSASERMVAMNFLILFVVTLIANCLH